MEINSAKKIKEIKEAVDKGQRVFWLDEKNPIGRLREFEVIKNEKGEYLIKCHANNHCIGLHGLKGSDYENVLNGEEHEFHFDERWRPEKSPEDLKKLRESFGLAPEPPSIG